MLISLFLIIYYIMIFKGCIDRTTVVYDRFLLLHNINFWME